MKPLMEALVKATKGARSANSSITFAVVSMEWYREVVESGMADEDDFVPEGNGNMKINVEKLLEACDD